MLISVIIPTYNRQQTILRSIRSILNQTIPRSDYEVIVIDDGSIDATSSILAPFEKELLILSHIENKGLPEALNYGIRNSRGQFMVRLDSDDFVLPSFLELLSSTLRLNNSIDAVACDYQLVDSKQNVLDIVNCMHQPIACGIMYRLDQIREIGMYNPDFKLYEDRELRHRFLQKYSYTRLPLPLYKYFMHSSNMSKDQELVARYSAMLDDL